MLLRLAYLTGTNTFAALRLIPVSDRDKDVEILALRHQITVLERQLGVDTRVRFAPEYRAFLAALLTSLPRKVLRRLRLLAVLRQWPPPAEPLILQAETSGSTREPADQPASAIHGSSLTSECRACSNTN
ncbi:hypothetical protein [Nonomuraea jabiensis]|uniref:hypothetical protein n=1 Tax=Nonomuraea jabiensis TaxID=882448 RepID=UPI003689A708